MHGLTGKAGLGRLGGLAANWLFAGLLALAGTAAASAQMSITNISPGSIPAGSADFSLVLTVANLPALAAPVIYWNDTILTPTVNGNRLTVSVTASLVAVPDTVQIYADIPGDVAIDSPQVPYSITGPAVASLSPAAVVAGHGAFTLTINGNGFISYQGLNPVVKFGSHTAPNVTLTGNSQLQITVSAAWVTTPGSVTVLVTDQDPNTSASLAFSFTVLGPLGLVPTSMPWGAVGSFYDFTFQTVNGAPPLTFAASGLPASLTLNAATGEVRGTPTGVGSYQALVTVTDANGQVATGQFPFSVTAPAPVPLGFTGSFPPSGQVGVPYQFSISATGGTPPYTFGLAPGSGGLPAGLTIAGSGAISGTPAAMGTSKFTVQVTDSVGGSAALACSVTILPAPLSITTGALNSSVAGVPINIGFAATGGYPGYAFSSDNGIPPGTAFSASGSLTGTPTTPGTYKFTVTVKDNNGGTASRAFSLVITAPPLSILTAGLANGQVGVAYSVQFYASNGQPPYTWAAAGGPSGIALSGGGSFSGTPTVDGAFTVAVTVADAGGNQAKQTYTLTIAAAPLTITTATLPSVVAGTAYSVPLAATGGDAPYTWAVQGLPAGIIASVGGALTGTPTTAGSYTVSATVTDSKGATAAQRFSLTVTAVPMAIATASLPNATVQSAYSATVSASGGAGSNKWTASGLPSGLAMSAGGVISGTPTAPGVAVVAVTVTDAAGTVAVATLTLTVAMPPAPGFSFGGVPASLSPGTQSPVQVGLTSAYPLAVSVTLTLAFAPDSGGDDPAVQFSTGGRAVVIQIPAGSPPTPLGNVSLAAGTVAGTITITAQLAAAGQNITPTPAPQQTIRIAAAAPVITSLTAVRTASGFTVTAIGFATPRQVTAANFQFSAASSANLQTGTLTIPVTSLFSAWYASAASAPFGSQFSFVQPFSVSGSAQGITSVTLTLTDAQGTSAALTATLQ